MHGVPDAERNADHYRRMSCVVSWSDDGRTLRVSKQVKTLDSLSVPAGKVRRSVKRRKIVASFRSHSLRTGRSDGGVTFLAMLS